MIVNSLLLNNEYYFEITNASELVYNKRIKVTFKRLLYIQKGNDILILSLIHI